MSPFELASVEWTRTSLNHMIILLEYRYSINRYCKEINNRELNIPPCPRCSRKLRRHTNRSVLRNVVVRKRVYRIPIIRLRCPRCDETFSLIPSFVTPYNSYANYIREFVGRWVLSGIPMTHILRFLTAIEDFAIVSLRTLHRWKRKWKTRFEKWYLTTRSLMASDMESSSDLLELYRNGMDSEQERTLVFSHFLSNSSLRQGKLLNIFNLRVPPAERW